MVNINEQNNELIREIEKLRRQIRSLKSKRKYGLVWETEKEPENIVLECQYKVPILREIKSRSVGKETPINVLIEGDNYHALSVLNYTHKGKIDVIYIDPPFNTGKKTWKYNNDYVGKDDEYKHSKWLNFMKNRLVLAKNLLKEKGALICAVDENECATLGLLLQQIFFNCKVDCISVIHNPRGIQGKNFSFCHEYAYFVYPDDKEQYIGTKPRPIPSLRNLRDNGGGSLRTDGKTCFYPIYVKNNKIIGCGEVPSEKFNPKKQFSKLKNGMLEVWPIDDDGVERKWRYSVNSFSDIQDLLQCKVKKDSVIIQILKEEDRYKTVWYDKKFDANEYGSKLLRRIVNEDFPFPKSLYTVKECLEAVCKKNKQAVVLDYFAGSGTTGHAVLEMNKEDRGSRSFILCTNNEGNICEDICYPRIKNVIEGYKYKGKEKKLIFEIEIAESNIKDLSDISKQIDKVIEDNKNEFEEITSEVEDSVIKLYGVRTVKGKTQGLGGNLKYFKTNLLDIDNISRVSDERKIQLTYQAGEMIALREGTFIEIEKNEWWQIFRNDDQYTAIYFKEDKTKLKELGFRLGKLKEKVMFYIFSWGKDEYKYEFSEHKNIKVEDIPEPIIDVYREVNGLNKQ
jgi:adenine-specific DNA-methyltransferase